MKKTGVVPAVEWIQVLLRVASSHLREYSDYDIAESLGTPWFFFMHLPYRVTCNVIINRHTKVKEVKP